MQTTEPLPSDMCEPSSSPAPSSSQATNAASPEPRPRRLYTMALGAALLAGLTAWLVGEATLNAFEPPPNYIRAMGILLNRPSFQARTAAELKNVALASAVLGACLGVALGAVAGLTSRSWRRGIVAVLAGLLLGAGAAAAATAGLLPVYYKQLDRDPEILSHDLILPFLIHSGTWAAVGATGGIALALGLRLKGRFAAIVIGAALGGILGAVVYETTGAVFFPAARTTEPLASEWAPRLIAKLAVCLLAAAGAVQAATSTRRVAVRNP